MTLNDAKTGILTLAAVLACGCNKGPGTYVPKPTKEVKLEEIKPDQGPELLPLKVGNRWTYVVESRQQVGIQATSKSDELALEVADIQQTANGQSVTLQSYINGEPTEKQLWIVDDRGIFQSWVGKETTKYEPPQPNVMFPLKPGPNFEWKGTGPTVVGKAGQQTYKATLLATQLVDTRMGKFSAIGVDSIGTFTVDKVQGQSRIITYWAKGVGLVRYKQDTAFMSNAGAVQGTQLITLKTYALK